MAELESKTIHSVAKAIRLLDLLAERTKPATLTELYQATGWPKSTIHGLLSTMRYSKSSQIRTVPSRIPSGSSASATSVRVPLSDTSTA